MAKNSIGLIELTSVASGFLACDAMLKSADVELVLSNLHGKTETLRLQDLFPRPFDASFL